MFQALKVLMMIDNYGIEDQVITVGISLKNCLSIMRASFKPIKTISISKPHELLHIDLCGLISLRHLDGSKYVFIIVDDYFIFT